MSFILETPQRPLPGTYFSTPAAHRESSALSARPDAFRSSSINYPMLSRTSSGRQEIQSSTNQPTSQAAPNVVDTLKPVERAARTINQSLAQETRFPELDSYVGQGISSDYDVAPTAPWAPFQKTKMYEIPDRIFEQYNRAQVSTMMGLFAELNLAWIAIDNALYLWDFTHPNPDLIGFEDQPNSITAVRLVIPRLGVFVSAISHLLVIATTAEILLVGLSRDTSPTGSESVSLYQTRMALSTKGMDITVIEGSSATGRIFFSNRGDNDVYELTYQQEEKWFQGRVGKVNRTSHGLATLAPNITFKPRSSEHVLQMVVDDTRNLLYTLSSTSAIRIFHMTPQGSLDSTINKPFSEILSNIGHMVSRTELLTPAVSIVSINPIPSNEASKLHLMATTSTGCRLFLSATAASSFLSGAVSGKPTSMQVQHIKFPPQQTSQTASPSRALTNLGPYQGPPVDTQSKALDRTRTARRYPPGYFFCFVPQDAQGFTDTLFISSPDPGRINRPQDPSQMMRTTYQEHSIWLNLDSRAEDVGMISPPFGAGTQAAGFGNELAVQFDKPASEFAILTNTGIHIIRRRRLVDIFAAGIRFGSGDDGTGGETVRFIRLYGRGEVIATALAVACGQGQDVTSDSRVAKITDPDILERARQVFIDYGGKPQLNENIVMDQNALALDNIRPSPRHEGLALYISRLVRSVWKSPVITEMVTPLGGLSVASTVRIPKLLDVQRDLTKLQEFLNDNKGFIDGLAGPDSLMHVTTKQDEVALQAEHRALHSLVTLITDIVEGISFVLVLFDERVEEIVLAISDAARQQMRQLTYEGLFATSAGKELAKELVKAIVNRNIANGSNVDTVAEALRRRCGSFCSADDVVIFKAQEQIKRAQEAGGNSDLGRRLLNESLVLFTQVSPSLSREHLVWALNQYVAMEFYGGAIKLALNVAMEADRGNRALSWLSDNKPLPDPREEAYNARLNIYKLVHGIIVNVDQASRRAPSTLDGETTTTAVRVIEANDEINRSTDEVFQYSLYDWYLEQGWTDRLLAVDSSYVEPYLQSKATQTVGHADLLWRYYSQKNRYFDAATVQLDLAKSDFVLPLEKRIEYLTRARTNGSTNNPGYDRQKRQALLKEVSDQLDIAYIQDDVLARLRSDARLDGDRKAEVLRILDGKVLSLDELFNNYTDQAAYYDLSLLIYEVADHRHPTHISATWQSIINQTHATTVEKGQPAAHEAVAETIRSMGTRLQFSESTFPMSIVVPLLARYAQTATPLPPPSFLPTTLLSLPLIPPITILHELATLYFNDEAPFQGRAARRLLARDTLVVATRWWEDGQRRRHEVGGSAASVAGVAGDFHAGSLRGAAGRSERLRLARDAFGGGEEGVVEVSEVLDSLWKDEVFGEGKEKEELRALRRGVDGLLR
ncbi:MAG: hypothetical protein M1833_004571 [Piccolia ochrophora]|nr:MAG: hypothetical protein M1833_004571 [Piccolia ochrophora]